MIQHKKSFSTMTRDESRRSKPKLTKDERRVKYTVLARKKSAKDRERAICFQCRQRGHTVANCPYKTVANCCYKCGSTEHSLARCPKRARDDDSLPFATCFVCKDTGHLASHCPQNSKGIYIHGGCCKACGSNLHRVTECPEKKKSRADENDDDDSDDNQDLLEEQPGRQKTQSEVGNQASSKSRITKRRVVTF